MLAALTCGDDARSEAAVALIAARGPAMLDALQVQLDSTNVDARWWAVRAIAAILHPRSVTLLTQALQDSAVEVRQCALLGLRLQPAEQAIPVLVALLSDSDDLCASLAGDALAAIGPAVVPALIEVLETGSQIARRHAARAASRLADPRLIPALFKALDTDSFFLEFWASEALERSGAGMVYYRL